MTFTTFHYNKTFKEWRKQGLMDAKLSKVYNIPVFYQNTANTNQYFLLFLYWWKSQWKNEFQNVILSTRSENI